MAAALHDERGIDPEASIHYKDSIEQPSKVVGSPASGRSDNLVVE